MGYRFEHTAPPDPEMFLPRFEMRNGTITDLAFPCFYLDVISEHDSKYHDHIGRPDPTHRDCICQYPDSGYEWIDFDNPHPIMLDSEEEGYDEAIAIFDEDISESIEVECSIGEHNTVYMSVRPMIEDMDGKPAEYKFTLLIHSTSTETRSEKMDQVIRGIIVVLPGSAPIGESPESSPYE